MIIEKEVEMEIDVDEIWDNLTYKEKKELMEYFYDEFKEDYKIWLIEEGLVKENDE